MNDRFVRLNETGRPALTIHVDGVPVRALQGDTLMVAMLCSGKRLRQSEFTDSARAGFCLMGACQDCWVWAASGERLRACTTQAEEGMSIQTTQPGDEWTIR